MTPPDTMALATVLVGALDLRNIRAETLDPDRPLFGPDGLGLDSLDALQITMAIEDNYGVRVPEGEEAKPVFRSVRTLTDYIAQQLTKPT